ncbi:MAG: hypothetical protein Q9218_007402 [Villophora microphyllina]
MSQATSAAWTLRAWIAHRNAIIPNAVIPNAVIPSGGFTSIRQLRDLQRLQRESIFEINGAQDVALMIDVLDCYCTSRYMREEPDLVETVLGMLLRTMRRDALLEFMDEDGFKALLVGEGGKRLDKLFELAVAATRDDSNDEMVDQGP